MGRASDLAGMRRHAHGVHHIVYGMRGCPRYFPRAAPHRIVRETRYHVIRRVSLLLCGTLGLCHTHPAVEQILGFAAIHSLLGKRIRLLEAVGERTVLKQMAVRDNRGSRVQQGGRT